MATSQVRPTFTLTIMLMMFVCQIFTTFASASVQYASNEHPLGDKIAHHHSHNHADEHHHDQDNTISKLSVNEVTDVNENDSEHEHEQNNHSHLSYFPPVDNSLTANAVIADAIDNIHSKYPNCKYAPAIPPPSV